MATRSEWLRWPESPCSAPVIIEQVIIPLAGCTKRPLMSVFGCLCAPGDHFALSFPVPDGARPLVRIHSSCLTGDVMGSLRCDCGPQLAEAIARCDAEGGVILYLDQEGRGIGLSAKIRAYALQDEGLDTFEANSALGLPTDARDYTVAAEMLRLLGIQQLRLLTNAPAKVAALTAHGFDVEVEPTKTYLTAENEAYLIAKRRHGHTLVAGTKKGKRHD